MDFDIIVIGSGPGGYTAAVRASELGFSVCVVERDKIGGVCLNVGCIPTKALINIAENVGRLRDGRIAGVENISFNINKEAMNEKLSIVSDAIVAGIEYLFKKNNVTVINGEATIIDKNTISVNGEKKSAKYIILATGSKNKSFSNINGSTDEKIISSTEALFLKTIPKSMTIIGGGAIGCEFGYIYSSLGTEITILEYLPNLLPNMDEECGKTLERSFKKQNIKVFTEASVTKIDNEEGLPVVEYTRRGKSDRVESEFVLVAMGRTPNLDITGIDSINLDYINGYVSVDKNMRSSVDNIYAVGDIVAKSPQLAHVAYDESRTAVEDIAYRENKIERQFFINYDLIPFGVYTEPQIAGFGESEKTAREKGINFKAQKLFMKMSGKAVAMSKSEGFVKILINVDTSKIIGCSIVGADATEILHEVLLCSSMGGGIDKLSDMMHAHPTISELISELAQSFEK